jgi:outer membrane protein TolC
MARTTTKFQWRLAAPAGMLVCAPALAAGQEAGSRDTLRLTLAQAEAMALRTGDEVAVARARRDQADAQVTQATAGLLPQVSTGLTYSRAIRTIFDDLAAPAPADTTQIPGAFDPGRSPFERYDMLSDLLMDDFMSGLFGGLPFGRRNTYVAALQLAQPLYAGGRLWGARRAATHLRSAAEHAVSEAEVQITLDVRTAYFDAVLARRLYLIAFESRRVAEAHYRQVESRAQAGTASEFDLLRARVDYENRQPAVVEAANGVTLALLGLKRLVNVPAEQPVVLVDEPELAEVAVDEDALRRLLDARPALAAAREAVAVREQAVGIARGERLPAVQLLANFGFQAYPEDPPPPGPGQWRRDWSVALAVSWNPFDGFRSRGRIRQAQAELRLARLEEAQLREGLTLELEVALAQYRSTGAQIRARRETVALAEQTHELAGLRYGSGLSTQLEVSDAALLLDQARVNEVQALHDYAKALAQLERLSGGALRLLGGRGS